MEKFKNLGYISDLSKGISIDVSLTKEELLENKKTPEYFLTNRIADSKMEELRKHYFNESDN